MILVCRPVVVDVHKAEPDSSHEALTLKFIVCPGVRRDAGCVQVCVVNKIGEEQPSFAPVGDDVRIQLPSRVAEAPGALCETAIFSVSPVNCQKQTVCCAWLGLSFLASTLKIPAKEINRQHITKEFLILFTFASWLARRVRLLKCPEGVLTAPPYREVHLFSSILIIFRNKKSTSHFWRAPHVLFILCAYRQPKEELPRIDSHGPAVLGCLSSGDRCYRWS